jgi:hypothetical protein
MWLRSPEQPRDPLVTIALLGPPYFPLLVSTCSDFVTPPPCSPVEKMDNTGFR